jgi:hypothetical protein
MLQTSQFTPRGLAFMGRAASFFSRVVMRGEQEKSTANAGFPAPKTALWGRRAVSAKK